MSDPVSRETPPAPAPASGVFASALPAAERYAALLADAGVTRGLIGPREVPRLWQRHLLNCALLGDAVPEGCTVADVGSGAGLPGVVLALLRPDLRVTLVEPLLRRTAFLEEVVAELGLSGVEVVRARAEDLHGQRRFGIVTARAVAPLERLGRWCLPLVEPGGALVAMKGRSAEEEVAAARSALRRLGATSVSVHELTAEGVETPTTVVRVETDATGRVGWAAGPTGSRSGPRSTGGRTRAGEAGGARGAERRRRKGR